MRAFSAQELLDAWERGLAEPPVRRALILVATACPEATFEDLARESVGRRDARLTRGREALRAVFAHSLKVSSRGASLGLSPVVPPCTLRARSPL